MAATGVYSMMICILVISALFQTAISRPNFLHQADSKLKDTSNYMNNIDSELAYIQAEANKAPAIDISLLDHKLPKTGYTPSAPSACHNMVIDTVGAARYSCWCRLSWEVIPSLFTSDLLINYDILVEERIINQNPRESRFCWQYMVLELQSYLGISWSNSTITLDTTTSSGFITLMYWPLCTDP